MNKRFVYQTADTIEIALCATCQFLKSGAVCEAFPQGIPQDILRAINNHKSPYPGDHGIQYKRINWFRPKKRKKYAK